MITQAHYDKLHKGMEYEEVCELLGSPGELISSETAQIEPGITAFAMQTDLYEWRNPDDSWVRLMFNQGQLHDAAEEGLE